MPLSKLVRTLILVNIVSSPAFTAADPAQPVAVHHVIDATISPATGRLNVIDRIRLPPRYATGSDIWFRLNPNLNVESAHVERAPGKDNTLWRARLLDHGDPWITIRYSGIVQTDEPARLTGHIGSNGIYLDHNATWYPVIVEPLSDENKSTNSRLKLTFELTVRLPEGWDAISQGERVRSSQSAEGHQVQWVSHDPQDQIHLSARTWQSLTRSVGGIAYSVHLDDFDAALAERYIVRARSFVEAYAKLIGPYPYSKFAVAENFWESGLGMPSFTLLGPRVIRLPFVWKSSLPHEVAHNWWGNGVYVDTRRGNWSEGLTAYLADHAIAELEGKGAAYRRKALKRYADYVAVGRDFPLVEFRSGHDRRLQAVGYGKALFLFHMLRKAIGDEAFAAGLSAVFARYKFSDATFDEVIATLLGTRHAHHLRSAVQWIERPGAPYLELQCCRARVASDASQPHTVELTLVQRQSSDPFELRVPVYLHTTRGLEKHEVALASRRESFALSSDAPIFHLEVDPLFDVFRIPAAGEIGATLSELFGAPEVDVWLGSDDRGPDWEEALAPWRARQRVTVVGETGSAVAKGDTPETPLWILGEAAHRLLAGKSTWSDAPKLIESLRMQGLTIDDGHVVLEGKRYDLERNVVVIAARLANDRSIGIVHGDLTAPSLRLARRLTHYGSFGVALFDSDTGKSVLRSTWSMRNHALSRALAPAKTDLHPHKPAPALLRGLN
jgi:hypothetical protein